MPGTGRLGCRTDWQLAMDMLGSMSDTLTAATVLDSDAQANLALLLCSPFSPQLLQIARTNPALIRQMGNVITVRPSH